MDDNEKEVPCTEDDIVACKYINCDGVTCNTITLVKKLRTELGPRLLDPSKNYGFHQTMYYYCRYCKDPLAKVFSWGDGRLVLAANVELVKEESAINS